MKSANWLSQSPWMIATAVFVWGLFATSVFAQDLLPTMEDIQTLYSNAQYRDAMTACMRIIRLRDDSVAGFDRHGARMICAECQLHLKLTREANDTLDAAADAAAKSGNSGDAAQAKALGLLVHASVNGYYIPKTGHIREPLDILDPTNRQTAYLALFNDQFEWCKQQQHASASAESLAPVLELAKTFDGVRAVEQISTQSTAQCDEFADQLASWSNTMVRNVLTSYDGEIDQIVRDTNIGANRRVHRGRQVPLNAQQTDELQQMLRDCQKVPAAIDQMNAAFAQPVQATADDDRAHAQNIVDRIKAIFAENDRVVAWQKDHAQQRQRGLR